MAPFLAAQVADPNDSSAMLIWADHLEEAGDCAGAAALRGLVGAGIASIHQLSLAAGELEREERFRHASLGWAGCGGGDGFQVARSLTGKGFGDGELHADSSGVGEGRTEDDETRTPIRLGPGGAHFGGLGDGESFGSRFEGCGEG